MSPLLRRLRSQALGWIFTRGEHSGTGLAVQLDELGLAHPEHNEYAVSSWMYLRWALRGTRTGPQDAFLDMGCGKGRVLLQAGRRRFARVVGVELSAVLAEEARRNLAAARSSGRLRCAAEEVVVADARTYELPDDVTVLYLYNPFTGETFARFAEAVLASLRRRPRDLTIVYAHPTRAAELLARGFVVKRRRRMRRPPKYEVLVLRGPRIAAGDVPARAARS